MDSELLECTGATEAGALADIIKDNFKPEVKSLGKVADRDVQVLIAPKGMDVHSLQDIVDRHLPVPVRRKGTIEIVTLDSLIDIGKRFRDGNSVIFGDPKMDAPSLLIVFNYSREGGDQITGLDGQGVARHGDHKALYKFPLSDEWKAWLGGNAQPMKQGDFAAFIEDRIADVEMPDPQFLGNITEAAAGGDFGEKSPMEQLANLARLLGGTFATPAQLVELSQGLSIRENQRIKNSQNLNSGEGSLTWEATHTGEDGKPLKVPNLFLIAIPLFIGGALYRIAV
ncbi:MAG TPA: DUF2303 family protein, partial [Reyranella sp.]|nr:DUF2303 family protein [Reyranella sp.]